MFLSNQAHPQQKGWHLLAGAAVPNPAQLRHRIEVAPDLDGLGRQDRLARLEKLIACGAWTDAAFELLAVAAPAWHLQRLCLDGGEWVCTLCRNPRLPDWLDETVESRAAGAALALVDAVSAAAQS